MSGSAELGFFLSGMVVGILLTLALSLFAISVYKTEVKDKETKA